MTKINKLRVEQETILREIRNIHRRIKKVREKINVFAQKRRNLISDQMVKKGIGFCIGCDAFLPIKDIKVLVWKLDVTEKRGSYCKRCLSDMIHQVWKYKPEVVNEKPVFDPRCFPEKVAEFVGEDFPTGIDCPKFK